METSTPISSRLSPPAKAANPDAATEAQPLNPLAQSAGLLRDDPFWEEMMESIRRHRREIDAEWDDAE